MKAIILAAGMGSRLWPLTEHQPKCMVNYNGRPLISYTIERLKSKSIHDIAVVTGYKAKVLEDYLHNENIKFYNNEEFASTNMLYSLYCAKEYMTEDIVVLYSDIVYSINMLDKLITSENDICVIIDKNWLKLWQFRMDNPLSDIEILKLNNNKDIIEIGGKPNSYDDIEGQFVGMMKFKSKVIDKLLNMYRQLLSNEDKKAKNIYTTDFLQKIIDRGFLVRGVLTSDQWIEVDTLTDLNKYEESKYFSEILNGAS